VKKKSVTAVDLFCGGGGTSTGLIEACRKQGMHVDLTALNHWDVAIATHTKNHPSSRHICERLDKVTPEELAPSGRIDLLVASPECTHFSTARGGKPMNNQSRATAWDILNLAEKIYIKDILIENVKEFQNWGPLGVNGRPIVSKKGETFKAFINILRSLGYRVEHNVLNAADYGSATTRHRLFIIARKGNRKIVWPVSTHAQKNHQTLFGEKQVWRAAREIIDWSIPGKSIFDRKKPLAPATLKRIEAGLRKFGGKNAEPFLVILRKHADAQSLNNPTPTITTSGSHVALCEPSILGQQSDPVARSVDQPIPTVSTDGAIAIVEPYLIQYNGQSGPQSVDDPMQALCTKNHMALVEPYLVTVNHGGGCANRAKSIDEPMATVTGSIGVALVEPFILNIDHAGSGATPGRSVEEPIGTITSKARACLVEPFIVPQFSEQKPKSVDTPLGVITTTSRGMGLCEPMLISVDYQQNNRSVARSLDEPIPVVTGTPRVGLVEPFITPFYGNSSAQSINEPLPTATTKDRFALVTVDGTKYYLDIRFRMLQWHELAAAMGFPKDYQFTGNRESVVKQIGNAVPVELSEALCASLMREAA
jgi:DNA (cytosine-5)-methyltransferase 1